jgi:hypothetical protein
LWSLEGGLTSAPPLDLRTASISWTEYSLAAALLPAPQFSAVAVVSDTHDALSSVLPVVLMRIHCPF